MFFGWIDKFVENKYKIIQQTNNLQTMLLKEKLRREKELQCQKKQNQK